MVTMSHRCTCRQCVSCKNKGVSPRKKSTWAEDALKYAMADLVVQRRVIAEKRKKKKESWKSMDVKELVKDKRAYFRFFREDALWYETENGFEFPVPIHDRKEIGNMVFPRDIEAIVLMKYISKHLNNIEKSKET